MTHTFLAIALMLAASGASSQMLYTSVSADGHKTFSDRPEEIPVIQPPRAPAGTMAIGSRRAATVNANEAQRRLVQAQQKRSEGRTPLAGEESRAGGAPVLNQRYWRRQENLRRQVEQAQQRSNALRQPLLARR